MWLIIMSGQKQMEGRVKGFFQFLQQKLFQDGLWQLSLFLFGHCFGRFFFFTVPDYTKFQFQFQTGIFVKKLGNLYLYKMFLYMTISMYLGYIQWKLRELKAIRLTLCKVMLIKQTVIICLVSWALSHYLWVRNHIQIEKGVSWNRQ